MELLWTGVCEAAELLVSGDALVLAAAWRSLWIASSAVALAFLLGVPVGMALARARFPGHRVLVVGFRAGMAVPTVFIGVVCYTIFSRRGPLGGLELLYTPWAIVIGELLLAFPIIVAITQGAVKSLDPRVVDTAQTLGARWPLQWWTCLSEARMGVMLAVLTAFARCVTELGIAMMVGGNITDRTRTLATATALETGRGEFSRAIAMGLLLVLIALGMTAAIVFMSREQQAREP